MSLFRDGSGARNRNCYFVFVLVTVSFAAASKYLSRANLKEEGLIWAGSFKKGYTVSAAKAWWQEPGTAGHTASAGRERGRLGSLTLASLEPQPAGKCCHI